MNKTSKTISDPQDFDFFVNRGGDHRNEDLPRYVHFDGELATKLTKAFHLAATDQERLAQNMEQRKGIFGRKLPHRHRDYLRAAMIEVFQGSAVDGAEMFELFDRFSRSVGSGLAYLMQIKTGEGADDYISADTEDTDWTQTSFADLRFSRYNPLGF